MKTIVFETYDEMSSRAAEIVIKKINENPRAVLGLSTGPTPLGLYIKLADAHKTGLVDFSSVIAFCTDEYYKISKDDPQSLAYHMRENLFKNINVKENNIHIPDGETSDPDAECRAYDEKIRAAGGIDLLIMGIGENGLIALNEPTDRLELKTHLTELSEITIKEYGRDNAPRQAITMGLGDIFKAKQILLLIAGQKKNSVAQKLLDNQITTRFPATLLKLHPNVLLICDREAYEGEKQ